MNKILIKIYHWIRFHTAIPKPTEKSLNLPEKDIIGAIVRLKNDPKKEEYEVLMSGSISRGPVGQFKPCISFLCRRPMFGYETPIDRSIYLSIINEYTKKKINDNKEKHYNYWWFRKDSLIFIR